MYHSLAKGALADVLEEDPTISRYHGPFQRQKGESVWSTMQAPKALHHMHCSVRGHQHSGGTQGTPSVRLRYQATGRPVDNAPIDFLRLKPRPPGHVSATLLV